METTSERKIIMVVEHEPEAAESLGSMLDAAGFEPVPVVSFRQAVALIPTTRVDLLLVNLEIIESEMPHGSKAGEWLQSTRKAHPELAIVLMVDTNLPGADPGSHLRRALQVGADRVALKPFETPTELSQILQRALSEKEAHREATRLQTLRPLLQISASLFTETRPDALMERVLDLALDHLNCEHAGFYHRLADETELRLVARRGRPLAGEKSNPSGGPLGQTDAWNTPIKILRDDAAEYPGLAEQMDALGLGSLMCAPAGRSKTGRSAEALPGSETNGVLLVARSASNPPFGEADLEMFVLLAHNAAAALTNAELYADLADSILRLEESQRALVQAEKMAAIGRMTASIAHEVNNPLQAMRNCLALAGRKDVSPKKSEEYLDMARDELERLLKTMRQMLNFYRPSAVNRDQTTLAELLAAGLALLENQIARQGIHLDLRLEPDLPPVFVVSNQIQQVILNVILNAMDAMPGGGQLIILGRMVPQPAGRRTKRQKGAATQTAEPKPQYLEVFFQDTGPGLTAEIEKNIFEPYTSTKEKGTGLGLSISYNILQAHGGALEVCPPLTGITPTPTRLGACFRMTLPVKLPQSKALASEGFRATP